VIHIKQRQIPISKPSIGDAEKRAVMAVLDSGMLVQGPRVAELEARWAEAVGARHAIATSNGTTALHVALLANGVGPGDEVITSPFTFIASVNSIVYTGAKPVFVDVRERCFNIDADKIEAAITPRTKAIIPVHLYGQPAQMDKIMAIADKHGLKVIEDCAQSIGADFHGTMTGAFGTGCYSLYATKNVQSAEGGMITTNDDAIVRACRMIRAHGMERRYYHDVLGFNFRMTDLHAAIGIAQIGQLDAFTARRRANAAYLNAHVNNERLVLPHTRHGLGHVWHQYTIRAAGVDRDHALAQLTEAGVGTGIFYPIPAHRQKHLVDLGLGGGSYPVAERLSAEVFSVPVHPALEQTDLEIIAEALNAIR
jgi:perosamine synthetase